MAFDEPEYVKIAWTVRAENRHGDQSAFRTETGVMTTGHVARLKFRRSSTFTEPSPFKSPGWGIGRVTGHPEAHAAGVTPRHLSGWSGVAVVPE